MDDGEDFVAFSAASSEAASSEHDDDEDPGQPVTAERRYVHIRLCVPESPFLPHQSTDDVDRVPSQHVAYGPRAEA
eukprot:2813444-Prymnesium_polylepis.1